MYYIYTACTVYIILMFGTHLSSGIHIGSKVNKPVHHFNVTTPNSKYESSHTMLKVERKDLVLKLDKYVALYFAINKTDMPFQKHSWVFFMSISQLM